MIMLCNIVGPRLEADKKLEESRMVKAGTTLTQLFTYYGVPMPSISWNLDSHPVDSLLITTKSDTTSLTAKDCTFKNAGKYEITATNVVGTDSVQFIIVVSGL